MLKSSHFTVASRIADYYNLNRYQSLCLEFGIIIPDLKPACYYRRHIRKNWESYTNRLLNRLVNRRKTLLFYYDFGKLLHFYCDFYTRPHTSTSILGFLESHVSWEHDLNKLIKEYFTLEAHKPLKQLQSMYKHNEEKKILIDLKYIQSICCYLCKEVGL